ncbi:MULTISPECIES: condensation domain-containing protein [Micrococcus]|uniref:condensation domain-containing protein n=1 Tax=Micrococcus TaxID=1269 RepID=UPI0011A7473B|nr:MULTISPECIES: condensation domain-containing protein [Micrococcus]
MALGEVDSEGWLVGHPQEPVWDLYRVEGTLDLVRLEAAWRGVTDGIDTLRFRIRDEGGQPFLYRVADAPSSEFEIADIDSCFGVGGLSEPAIDAVSEHIGNTRCGPEAALAKLLVLRDGFDFLLCFSIDHGFSDGWSLSLILKRLSRAYRSGASGSSAGDYKGASLEGFLNRWIGEVDISAARRELSDYFQDIESPGSALCGEEFSPERGDAFFVDSKRTYVVPTDVDQKVSHLAEVGECFSVDVWNAAVSVTARRCSQGPQPLFYIHHGRVDRRDFNVVGPLYEARVLRSARSGSRVGEQISELAAVPALRGANLREMGLTNKLRFAVDHVPESSPIKFDDDVTGRPILGAELGGLSGSVFEPSESAATVWVTIYRMGDRSEVGIEYASASVRNPDWIFEELVRAIRDE